MKPPTPSTSPRQARRAGFTLVELIVVLVVIGVLAGSVVVALKGRDTDHALRAAARDLAATVRYAADRGRRAEQPYAVVFTDDDHAYRVQRGQLSGGSSPARGAAGRGRRLPAGVVLELPESVRQAASVSRESPSLVFTARSGFAGVIRLRAEGDRTAAIVVMPQTCQVRVEGGGR